MVFRYYGLPNLNGFGNFQCGIVAAWFGGPCLFDCGLCVLSIPSMTAMEAVIEGYGPFAISQGVPSPVISALRISRHLTVDEIAAEISNSRPIVAGISPSGGVALPEIPQHVAVIVGYDFSAGQQLLVVNDPFPFDFVGAPNPYTFGAGAIQSQVGQYVIDYASFVTLLRWSSSIYGI